MKRKAKFKAKFKVGQRKPLGVMKKCDNCGDHWSAYRQTRKCILCGGDLTTVHERREQASPHRRKPQ